MKNIYSFMNNTKIGLIVLALLVGLGVYFVLRDRPDSEADNSLGLRVGDHAVAAFDQQPDDQVVVTMVSLGADGFVVIHEDANGAPGAVLGSSVLLSGDTRNVVVELSRNTRDGERLYAALHLDDGDGVFNAESDEAARDSLGNELRGEFTIDAEAEETGEIVL